MKEETKAESERGDTHRQIRLLFVHPSYPPATNIPQPLLCAERQWELSQSLPSSCSWSDGKETRASSTPRCLVIPGDACDTAPCELSRERGHWTSSRRMRCQSQKQLCCLSGRPRERASVQRARLSKDGEEGNNPCFPATARGNLLRRVVRGEGGGYWPSRGQASKGRILPNERLREVAGAAAPSVDERGKTGGQHSDKAARDSWGQRRVPVCNRKDLTPLWRDWVWPGLKKTPVTYSGLRKPVWEWQGRVFIAYSPARVHGWAGPC